MPAGFRSAPSLTGAKFSDLVRIAKGEGWPGYFGAPRLASAALGAQEFALSSQNVNAMALRILDGLDSRKIPRYVDEMDPLNVVALSDFPDLPGRFNYSELVRHTPALLYLWDRLQLRKICV